MKRCIQEIWSWILKYKFHLVVVMAMIVLWASVPFWLSFFPGIGSVERRGQFGDSFGSLNALFSGLAFLGVIYAIRLQSRELKAQQKELKFQREELELQRKVMQKDTFERTFFRLLELFDARRRDAADKGIFGSSYFVSVEISYVRSVSRKVYFLFLLQILQFVSEANLGADDEEDRKIKKFYTDILRDDISFKLPHGQEIKSLLFLLMDIEDCIETFPYIAHGDFVNFAEEYALLSHIEIDYLVRIWEHGFNFCLRLDKESFADNHSTSGDMPIP